MAVFTLADSTNNSTLNTESLNLQFLFSFDVNSADRNTIFLTGFGQVFLTGENLTIRETAAGKLRDVTGGTLQSMTVLLGSEAALTIGGLDLKAGPLFDLVQAGSNRKVAGLLFGDSDVFILGDKDDQVFSRGGDDIVFAKDGSDTLAGGAGHDTLIGGDGDDAFIFNAPLGNAHSDRTDAFSSGSDQLFFDNDIFTRLGPLGTVAASRLAFGTAAGDANDRLIYNSTNGKLWYDADGTGAKAKVLIAEITPGMLLTTTAMTIIE